MRDYEAGLKKKEQLPTICSLQKTYFRLKGTNILRKGIKERCYADNKDKKAGVAIMTSNKIDIKTKMFLDSVVIFHSDKRISPSRSYGSYKHI